MKKFKITDKYSIEQFDSRNWIINRKMDINTNRRKEKSQKEANDATFGYYYTLQEAKEGLAELIGREACSFKELDKWINKIKEI